MKTLNINIPIKPYLEEILLQIESAEKSLSASGDIFDNIHHFLIHCAIVHKIIFPNINSKKVLKKRDKKTILKGERNISLKQYFKDCKSITENQSIVDIRNHLEHIDERLDQAVKAGLLFDKNISFGSKIENSIKIEGLKNESILRNYENGCFTFYGESCEIEDVKIWLDGIKNYILKRGIPKGGCRQFTNNVIYN